VYRLIVMLRLGVLLNIKRQESFLPEFEVDVEKDKLSVTFPAEWLSSKPIMTADLEREKGYQSAVGIELNVS